TPAADGGSGPRRRPWPGRLARLIGVLHAFHLVGIHPQSGGLLVAAVLAGGRSRSCYPLPGSLAPLDASPAAAAPRNPPRSKGRGAPRTNPGRPAPRSRTRGTR